ncbi:MAG: DNA recombination protein RmuC [Alphaproteobacteria bacterium]|nr:DNA recombination protein RmuC [Alphaproteobacteria bacterium]
MARLLGRWAAPASGRPAPPVSDDAEDLRRLFELSPQIPWLADAGGHVVRFNARWRDLLGISDAEARRAWYVSGHPDDLAALETDWARSLATGAPFDHEHRVRLADGSYHWFRSRAFPHRDATGAIDGWYGVSEDIDELKRTQAELGASRERLSDNEQRLDLAMTAARFGAWEWDLVAKRGWWSPRACEIMGVPPGTEPTPELRWGLVHPDDREAVQASAAEAAAAQGGYEQRYRIVRPDGAVRWVLSRGRANLEEGQRLTVSGVIQDVTDEEATRRALADSETRLLRSQAIAGIGSYEWNLQTGVGEFSPNLLRLAGLPPEARPTLPELIEHVHPDDRAAVAEAAAKAAAGASHAEIEYRFVRPDGSVRWARDVGSTTRNSDGVPFWAGVIIDITAMREAADRIAESEVRTRLIHEFAGVGTWEFVVGDGMRWSPEIYRLYDRDPGDGPPDADGWSAMLHPDDVGTAMIPLKTLTPDQADFLAEFRVRRADGGWRWLQGQGRVVRDAAGAIVRVLGINIDISDRKAAEEALRQRERQLLSFVEHAPVGIAMFDREMRYLAASERFLADLGFGRDEVLGRCHYEVVPDIPERWREIHRRALAGETLRKNQQQFIEMATETFKVQREKADAGLQKNKAEMAELIAPMRDTLSRYEEQIKAIEVARAEAYGQLKSQIETVAQGQLAVRDEAAKLVSALRSSGKTAGSWGEQQLRNVLEMAGLREGLDFSVQTSTDTEDGKRRPDAIIRLPGGRELIIDSKCSLNDYLAAGEADGEDARRAAYKRHALAVRAHAKGLGEKAYWNEFGKSADFVVMFLPGENFLSAALEHDLALLGWAFDQRILLAGPINLLAIAKTVALVWRQETLAEEAQRIGELGADLHAAIATMADHVARVGGNLDSAVRAYDDFVGSLERNVLPKARRFTEMGVEKGKKQVAEVKPVAKTTRTRVAPELIALPKGEAAE